MAYHSDAAGHFAQELNLNYIRDQIGTANGLFCSKWMDAGVAGGEVSGLQSPAVTSKFTYCISVSENKMSYSFLTTVGVVPVLCLERNVLFLV